MFELSHGTGRTEAGRGGEREREKLNSKERDQQARQQRNAGSGLCRHSTAGCHCIEGHIGVEKKKTMRHDEDDEQDDEYECKGQFSPQQYTFCVS